MQKFNLTALSLALSFTFGLATAPVHAMQDEAATNECTSTLSARDSIRDQIMEFRASEFGQILQERDAAGEITFIVGDAVSVNAPVTRADFGKSREMAFARSFLNTQSKFILKNSRDLQTEIVNDRFDQAPSQQQMSFSEGETDGEFWQLGNKLYQLAEAKLNAALAEEGVPAEEYADLNPKKKVDLYRESLTRKTAQQALGRIAGLVPVMNFEASDCNGRAAVATVAVWSQKTEDFTRAFINGKAFMPDAGSKAEKPISQQIVDEINSDEVIDLWGLRMVRDEEGYPALVSYGQWSYMAHSGSVRSNERREDTALIQAENNAAQQLALFLNGTATTRTETEIEEFVNEFVELEKTQNGVNETTEVIDEIVERTLSRTAARANVSIKGLSSPIRWVKPYPNDASAVQLTGAVVYWTPNMEDSVNKARGNSQRRAGGKPDEQAKEAAKKVNEANTRKSKVKNNARDF